MESHEDTLYKDMVEKHFMWANYPKPDSVASSSDCIFDFKIGHFRDAEWKAYIDSRDRYLAYMATL